MDRDGDDEVDRPADGGPSARQRTPERLREASLTGVLQLVEGAADHPREGGAPLELEEWGGDLGGHPDRQPGRRKAARNADRRQAGQVHADRVDVAKVHRQGIGFFAEFDMVQFHFAESIGTTMVMIFPFKKHIINFNF